MKKLFLLATLVTALAAATQVAVAAAPITLTLKAAPLLVPYGASTMLSGTLSTQRTGQTVTVEAQECGKTAFSKIATATTTTGGAFSVAAKPTINTIYRVREKAATSPTVSVRVAPVVVLKKLTLHRFNVAVTAGQSLAGKTVSFQRLVRTKWVTLKKVVLKPGVVAAPPTVTSVATFRITLPTRLKLRTVLPATQAGTCYATSLSKVIRS
jgi:hypothetical protein